MDVTKLIVCISRRLVNAPNNRDCASNGNKTRFRKPWRKNKLFDPRQYTMCHAILSSLACILPAQFIFHDSTASVLFCEKHTASSSRYVVLSCLLFLLLPTPKHHLQCPTLDTRTLSTYIPPRPEYTFWASANSRRTAWHCPPHQQLLCPLLPYKYGLLSCGKHGIRMTANCRDKTSCIIKCFRQAVFTLTRRQNPR